MPKLPELNDESFLGEIESQLDALATAPGIDRRPKASEQRPALPEQLRYFASAVENAAEGIVIMIPGPGGADPSVVFVNDGYCRVTGMSREEVLGDSPHIFNVSESDRAVLEALLHPYCQGRPFEGEAVAHRKNGAQYTLELFVVPIYEAEGALSHWVAYLRDVSERKAQVAALEHQALHDGLTNLPNRLLLRDRLEQATLVQPREHSPVALLAIDLDRFKEVNDTFGHHSGDYLLQEVAARLRQLVRASDTVARMGGDEFAIVLPKITDGNSAVRVARKILNALDRPFVIDGQPLTIGASIGIALCPNHGDDPDVLMRRADIAMYLAKNSNSGYSLYSVEQDRALPGDLLLTGQLRSGIESNQLLLYYQPKVHLRTGLVTRVEALVRWQHPENGLMAPDTFIPLAERTGLIWPLTEWVLGEALRQCRQWHDQGVPLHVAVNLSPRSLQQPALPQRVSDLLEKWKVHPRYLKLEITESCIMADPPQVMAILSLLQSLGVRLSLDDFGTGYSSLVHLRQLSVDEIKIDKSFILEMTSNQSDAAVVRATIDLAHNLGRQVVAEGVDNEETCRILCELGCDLAQGFYFSRPVPAAELTRWLQETQWGLKLARWVARV